MTNRESLAKYHELLMHPLANPDQTVVEEIEPGVLELTVTSDRFSTVGTVRLVLDLDATIPEPLPDPNVERS